MTINVGGNRNCRNAISFVAAVVVGAARSPHTHTQSHGSTHTATAQLWKQNCKFRELFVYLLFDNTIFGCFTLWLLFYLIFYIFLFKLLGLTMGRMCWCGSESKSKVVSPLFLSHSSALQLGELFLLFFFLAIFVIAAAFNFYANKLWREKLSPSRQSCIGKKHTDCHKNTQL